MQESLLQQGLDITLFGMGIVFTFLLVLIICTTLMSRAIGRFLPEAAPEPVASGAPASTDDVRLKKIIKAAIEQHRKNRR
ncbi:OadG family transporter subunit [uncultured Microbulbifer sp.]|uniref:OadG family protein n=1 Tax=uncultured Microbulbifer sp. TaxID=348147 RepID=UPI0025D9F5C9|nr:OadG family transporter subunit [uncultured Microbulbifer sp.]